MPLSTIRLVAALDAEAAVEPLLEQPIGGVAQPRRVEERPGSVAREGQRLRSRLRRRSPAPAAIGTSFVVDSVERPWNSSRASSVVAERHDGA